MKKRMATLAIVGAMAVTAMAPATVFAATPVTSNSNVYYEKGTGSPDEQGRYVISFPADIVFDDNGDANATQEVALKKITTDELPTTLSVQIDVATANGMKLKNNNTTINYSLVFSGNGVTGTNELNTTTAGTENAKLTVANLTPTDNTIAGTAVMETSSLASIQRGVEFKDVLTYTATHSE